MLYYMSVIIVSTSIPTLNSRDKHKSRLFPKVDSFVESQSRSIPPSLLRIPLALILTEFFVHFLNDWGQEDSEGHLKNTEFLTVETTKTNFYLLSNFCSIFQTIQEDSRRDQLQPRPVHPNFFRFFWKIRSSQKPDVIPSNAIASKAEKLQRMTLNV